MNSSRWSSYCASPCKTPIRKPDRRGSQLATGQHCSQFLVLPQQWQAEAITTATTLSWLALDDDTSLDGVDSIIYYCMHNRWMVDLQQDEKNNDKLSKPMRRPSVAMVQQQQQKQQ
jgi:hypothetical protein